MQQRLGEVLCVLSDIAMGEYQSRCSADLPVTHPLGALFIGVNHMIDALQAESTRRADSQRELEEKLATIQAQNALIRELSTPIIEVWDGVLCLIVIGLFDADRSSHIVVELLESIVRKRAQCAIIDLTGTEISDAAIAGRFARMIGAVQLIGSHCIVTGITPKMASNLVQLGLDPARITSYPTLRDALKFVMRRGLDRRFGQRLAGAGP